ncbi:hypothetical protein Mapa_007530 [Marchantia paleacea]|nr:hypothetical protein Mapa_007530 [Marchantia paleacea]
MGVMGVSLNSLEKDGEINSASTYKNSAAEGFQSRSRVKPTIAISGLQFHGSAIQNQKVSEFGRAANAYGKPPLHKMMSHASADDLTNSYANYMGNSEGDSSEGECQQVHDSSGFVEAKHAEEKFEQYSNNLHDQGQKFKRIEAGPEESETEDEDEEEEHVDWVYPEDKMSVQDMNYGVDSRDLGTSDDWIQRHPSLVRLTGRHPFNCEPPLSSLMEHGFITPASIHYVRNHGYVPHGDWDNWKFEVSGLVKRPMKLSMEDLSTKFPQREFPCTLVCAGNRRKEQNMTAQSIGFNWGAAAVSTSVWKGVRLCEVLRYCGVMSRKKGARYVCFEGAETLPAAGGSKYGTSLTIEKALDDACDVILAYQQNGRRLEPDHGYPLRMIIPGHIGGRMVKWLTSISVTSQESGNHYHYNDNRVLPSHLDAETAKAEGLLISTAGWWYKPDYIINELNINSVITTPAHNEVLPFDSIQKPYKVKGYAYTGGGRKVTRVEVSLDAGETWRLCDIDRPERPTKHGKYWCWVLWEVDVEVTDFLQSKELVVRAWDSALNTQADRLTWNVMGMMNNCWFRVKVQACKTTAGGIGLNFEHPTCPGNQPGGWMAKLKQGTDSKAQPVEPVPAKKSMVKSSSTPSFRQPSIRQISMIEVRRHTHSESAWIVVHGSVYDCTGFLHEHPGGVDSILLTAGTDATEEFDAIHSDKAKVLLEKYKIGELLADSDHDSFSACSTPDSSLRGGSNFKYLSTISESPPILTKPVALNPKERISFQLIEKEKLSANVCKLRFGLQSKEHILGLPVGKHVLIAANINNRLVMRAYTPVSCDKDVGYFDLLVKVYFKNESYPSGGLMSQHLDNLNVGEWIMVKGPLGHIHYRGKGQFDVNSTTKQARKFAMIAGGTGITPIYQVIRAILEDPEDSTDISLIYCNRSEADIMLKDELDEWQEKHSNFRVWYTVTGQVREGWKYGTGRMSEKMMAEHLPPSASDTYAFICGPPTLENTSYDTLERLGYDRKSCFSF